MIAARLAHFCTAVTTWVSQLLLLKKPARVAALMTYISLASSGNLSAGEMEPSSIKQIAESLKRSRDRIESLDAEVMIRGEILYKEEELENHPFVPRPRDNETERFAFKGNMRYWDIKRIGNKKDSGLFDRHTRVFDGNLFHNYRDADLLTAPLAGAPEGNFSAPFYTDQANMWDIDDPTCASNDSVTREMPLMNDLASILQDSSWTTTQIVVEGRTLMQLTRIVSLKLPEAAEDLAEAGLDIPENITQTLHLDPQMQYAIVRSEISTDSKKFPIKEVLQNTQFTEVIPQLWLPSKGEQLTFLLENSDERLLTKVTWKALQLKVNNVEDSLFHNCSFPATMITTLTVDDANPGRFKSKTERIGAMSGTRGKGAKSK